MFEEYLKHLRQKPIDHRLTVKTECGVRVVNLLTTDRIERAGCIPCLQAVGVQPQPKTPAGNEPAGGKPRIPNTMAEAFCGEHLRTWTERGEDFTDWRDGNTQDNLERMGQIGALTLFEPTETDGCFMILTVFLDQSWIIQQEPPSGAPPIIGAADDEQRFPDFIKAPELEGGQKPQQKPQAEAFCEEHLITWTEHGEDFTDWRDGDIYANLHRMTQAGAATIFQPMEKEGCFIIVTVFPDRSWIVQEEPPGGAPPMVGTREDERRIPELIHILEFIHQALAAGQKPEPEPEPPEFPAYLDTQRNGHAEF